MLRVKKRFKKAWMAILCTLTVALLPIVPTESISATTSSKTIKLSKTELQLTQGRTATLKVLNTKEKAVFTSSNVKVAKVNKNTGRVSARNIGKTTITATLKNGKKYKCKVTVTFQNANVPKVNNDLIEGKKLVFTEDITLTLPQQWDYELYEKTTKYLQYICLSIPDNEYKGCIYVTGQSITTDSPFQMKAYTKQQLSKLVSNMQKSGYLVQGASYQVMKSAGGTIGIMSFKVTKDDIKEYETILIQKKGNNLFFYECIGTSKSEKEQYESVALFLLNSLEMDETKVIKIS